MPDLEPIEPLPYSHEPESIDELIEHERICWERHSRSIARANKLNHMRKVIRGQIFLMQEGGVAERENKAEAHPEYLKHLELIERAETAANICKARANAMTHRYEMWRTRSANKRQEMKL